jgi:hypothetical protein
MSCSYGSEPEIINCTFSRNSSSRGGGFAADHDDSMPTLESCILWLNEAVDDPEITAPGGFIEVTRSDVRGGWEGEGNLDVDPLFCDPDNDDYHLSAFSPCAPGVQPNLELIGALAAGCHDFICGDADGDGELALADLQHVFNFYFGFSDVWPYPVGAGDMDCDGAISLADVVLLADYIHGIGRLPCCVSPTVVKNPSRPSLER